MLCYRHHPDYRGIRPTREVIERLHLEHVQRQVALQSRHPSALSSTPGHYGTTPADGSATLRPHRVPASTKLCPGLGRDGAH